MVGSPRTAELELGAPAIGVPATRRSLRRRWLLVLAPVLIAGGLLGLCGWRVRADSRADAVRRHGVATDALVVAVDAQPVGRARTAAGSIRVRLLAAGASTEASIYVGPAVRQYQPGQHVRVVYDPSDPTRAEIAGSASSRRGVPAAVLVGAAALLLVMAMVAGRHARQIGQIVRHHPWVALSTRLVQVSQVIGFRPGSRTEAVLDAPTGALVVEPIGLNRLDATFAPTSWVAGPGNQRMVLAPPGGGHLVLVRRWHGRARPGQAAFADLPGSG